MHIYFKFVRSQKLNNSHNVYVAVNYRNIFFIFLVSGFSYRKKKDFNNFRQNWTTFNKENKREI